MTTNAREWWLDLRHGLDPTAWWGPHTHPGFGITTMAAAPLESSIKGYVSTDLSTLLTAEEPNTYADQSGEVTTNFVTIISTLMTKAIDAGRPFDRKIFTRFRLNGRVDTDETVVSVGMVTDGGMVFPAPPITLIGSVGSQWNVATWDVSTWTASGVFHEGESIFEADRPRGQYAEVTLTHNQPTAIQLRDFELRYIQSDRPVATYRAT